MDDFINLMSGINIISATVRLLLSVVLGGIIGFDRGRRGRAAGFRTHILVCIGSCMAALAGLYVTEVLGYQTDPMRIAAQVISGIGFLGVGTILVTGNMQVRGLTTAAGLWSTAAVGICVGIGFYDAAIVCALLIVIVIVLLHKLDNVFFANGADIDIYFEVNSVSKVNNTISAITGMKYRISEIDIRPPKSVSEGSVGVEMTIKSVKKSRRERIIPDIEAIDGVTLVIRRD